MTESQFYRRLKYAAVPPAVGGVLMASVAVLSALSTDAPLADRVLVGGVAAFGSFMFTALSYALWRMGQRASHWHTE